MPTHTRFAATPATRFVFLFLAFAVFSWGMQAKVSVYKIHASSFTVAGTKLLTEERADQLAVSLKAIEFPVGPSALHSLSPFAGTDSVIPFPSFRLRQLNGRRYNPCGCDSQSVIQMRRPPPALI